MNTQIGPQTIHELEPLLERLIDVLRIVYYADVCRAGCTWTSHSLLGRPATTPTAITAH